MARIEPIDLNQAEGKAKTLLEGVQKNLGMTPNLIRTMANSAATLQGYLGLSGAVASGRLSAKLREQIALAVSESNQCDYCLAAHSALGKAVGLSQVQTQQARRGIADDDKTAAALRFAKRLVEDRGHVSDGELDRVREAGYSDGEITEIVANVALHIFTNYFNHVAQTEVDFPKAEPVTAEPSCAC